MNRRSRFQWLSCAGWMVVALSLVMCGPEVDHQDIGLNVPSHIKIKAGDGNVTIWWNPVMGATAYSLFYAKGSAVTTDDVKIEGVSSPAVIGNLENGEAYAFAVQALDSVQSSALSPAAMATPVALGLAPGAPSLIRVGPGDSQIMVEWDPVDLATSYDLYYKENASTVANADYSHILNNIPGVIPRVTQMIDHLKNGIPYAFAVVAVNTFGRSALSDVVVATPMVIKMGPSAPAGLISLGAGDGYVGLKWNAVAGATHYRVYFKAQADFDKKEKSDGVSGDFEVNQGTLNGLANGTLYYFRVVAANDLGESPLSELPVTGMPNPFESALLMDSWNEGKITIAEMDGDWWYFSTTPGTMYRIYGEDAVHHPIRNAPSPTLTLKVFVYQDDKKTLYSGCNNVGFSAERPFINVPAVGRRVYVNAKGVSAEARGTYFLKVIKAPSREPLVLDHVIPISEALLGKSGIWGLAATGNGDMFYLTDEVAESLRLLRMGRVDSVFVTHGPPESLMDVTVSSGGQYYFQSGAVMLGGKIGFPPDLRHYGLSYFDIIQGVTTASIDGSTYVFGVIPGNSTVHPPVPTKVNIYTADLEELRWIFDLTPYFKAAYDVSVDSLGIAYIAGLKQGQNKFVLIKYDIWGRGGLLQSIDLDLAMDDFQPQRQSGIKGMAVDEISKKLYVGAKLERRIDVYSTEDLALVGNVSIPEGYDKVGCLTSYRSEEDSFVAVSVRKAPSPSDPGPPKWEILVYRETY